MLDIQPATILWTIVNLLVLYFFFRKYLFGRVNAVLDGRAAQVESQLADAKTQQDQAEALKADYEQQLQDAEAQAAKIVSSAKSRGQREYETLLRRAAEDVARLKEDTREQLDSQREEMLRGARREVAALALLTAAKVSGRVLDGDGDRALVDAFLSEAGEPQ